MLLSLEGKGVYHSLAACACPDLQSTLHFLTNKLPDLTVYRCRAITKAMCNWSRANLGLRAWSDLPLTGNQANGTKGTKSGSGKATVDVYNSWVLITVLVLVCPPKKIRNREVSLLQELLG